MEILLRTKTINLPHEKASSLRGSVVITLVSFYTLTACRGHQASAVGSTIWRTCIQSSGQMKNIQLQDKLRPLIFSSFAWSRAAGHQTGFMHLKDVSQGHSRFHTMLTIVCVLNTETSGQWSYCEKQIYRKQKDIQFFFILLEFCGVSKHLWQHFPSPSYRWSER